ncbi:MAG: DNA polymerase IV [Candidatus Methanolliviera sp. GoM_asphalt]|nr:MAG: DNA polymerase IV [Candidatus Methanolliviera sp. GoM_asphalt]
MRVILHLDMDSFFSAIEVREDPNLKGLPVIVGKEIEAEEKEGERRIRGVVSTCSYEAREYGIHSGMAISRAYELCPDAKFLPVNRALYEKVSKEIMEIVKRYADKFEQVSIDEAFLDVSTKVKDWNEARGYAYKIKKETVNKEGLTCSIGAAPNKMVAKIASDFAKPDGLTVVEEAKVKMFLDPLPVGKIPGVGPKTEKILSGMGIERIGQLAEYDTQELFKKFGRYGRRLYLVSKGIDESEIKEKRERKSLGRERTFAKDTKDPKLINTHIDDLASKVYEALKEGGFLFRTISVKVKFEDFAVHTRSKTIKAFYSDLYTLKKVSKDLMEEFVGEKNKKIRLVGVRVSNLAVIGERGMVQRSLYEF